jgi:hypothetical protein
MREVKLFPGLLVGLMLLSSAVLAPASISISINVAPPVLRVYQQPLCPIDGYLWTPGYWAYGGAGYYWIPGAWVAPPQVGFLWTPGYWGFADGIYSFNAGYWGPTVGFYGGVNYGFGYGGTGFEGGRWQNGSFAYNTAVSRVNASVTHNTYNQAVMNHGNNRTSFNGGPGGISARPSPQEAAVASQHHVQLAAGRAAYQPVSAIRSNPGYRTHPAMRANGASPNVNPPADRRAAQQPRAQQSRVPQQTSGQAVSRAPSHPAEQQRAQARPAAPQRQAPQREAAPQRAAASPRGAAPRPQQKEERK